MTSDNAADAWCRGFYAGQRGAEASDNPYAQSPMLADFWQRGWEKGKDTALPTRPSDRDRGKAH